MKTLVLVLFVSTLCSINGDDNLAMETDVSYQTSYKVHPDPQDFEETDQSAHNYQSYLLSNGGSTGLQTRLSQNYHAKRPIEASDSNSWHTSNGESNEGEVASVHQPYGTVTRGLQIPLQQQQQHFSHRYRVQAVAPSVHQQRYTAPNDPTSGFSSVVEHSDSDHSPSEHQGPTNDIKRVVPKSTVFFKMYHGDKAGGEQKAEFESNVSHESHQQHQQSDNGQQIFIHNYMPENDLKEYGPYVANYLVSKEQEKVPYHSKTSGVVKHQTYSSVDHQTSAPASLKEQKLRTVQNYLKSLKNQEQMQLLRGQHKYKMASPMTVSNVHSAHPNYQFYFQQQPVQEQSTHLKVLSYQNQNAHPAYATDSQSVSVSNFPKFYEHGEKVLKTFKRPVHHREKYNGHAGKDDLKFFLDAKTRSQSPKGLEAEQQQQQSSYSVKEEEFPRQPHHQLELNVKENNAVPSTVSNTVLTHSLVPIKPDDLTSARYHKQLTWKNFDHLRGTDLPLVTKPADTFHFEINPFIDIGESSQFDHQKALEGSTSFDIKHAIGTSSELVRESSGFSSPSHQIHNLKHADEPSLALAGTPAFVYSTTPSYKVLATTPSFSGTKTSHLVDSLTSNSDVAHPSVEINSKYLRQPQTISTLSEDQIRQPNSLPVHSFDQSLLKLHIPNLKSSSGQLATVKHKFYPYKSIKDGNWLQEMHLQQYKKNLLNQHLHLHGRQSQRLFPVANDDWHLRKVNTRTGKSSRIVLKPEIVPYFESIGKKMVIKRINREAKWNPRRRHSLDGTQKRNKNVTPEPIENGPKNEFPVSASYKIDRSFKK